MNELFDVTGFRSRVSNDLKSAMKRRETNTVAALRNVLHILDNTGAVPTPSSPTVSEVTRRTPSRNEVENLLRREIDELSEASNVFRRHGQIDRAEALDAKAGVVELCVSYLSET
jgi:uncharacterized protein YqeY